MKRIAIFGNAGGGKSTLAREIAGLTGLPLHVIDEMQFGSGGVAVATEVYHAEHAALIRGEHWVIDGFGGAPMIWERLEAADTLVHVDLPLSLHGWWVTKRMLKGLFSTPPGWPEGSPVLSSTLSSYRVLWPCHKHLTPKYRKAVADAASRKRVFHIRSRHELDQCLDSFRVTIPA